MSIFNYGIPENTSEGRQTRSPHPLQALRRYSAEWPRGVDALPHWKTRTQAAHEIDSALRAPPGAYSLS